MKKITLIITICAALASAAQEETPHEVGQLFTAIEEATGWTADEIVEGLDRVCRFYSNDVQRAEGRVRWHGKVIRTVNDTNTLVRTEIHEDGTEFTSRFSPARPRGVKERLDSAAAKKAREEREARKRAEQIETEKAKLAELMKKYPAELAALLVTNAVNRISSTNFVDGAVVTPQN